MRKRAEAWEEGGGRVRNATTISCLSSSSDVDVDVVPLSRPPATQHIRRKQKLVDRCARGRLVRCIVFFFCHVFLLCRERAREMSALVCAAIHMYVFVSAGQVKSLRLFTWHSCSVVVVVVVTDMNLSHFVCSSWTPALFKKSTSLITYFLKSLKRIWHPHQWSTE